MKKSLMGFLVAAALLVSGCASTPDRPGANPRKSAEINAELGLRYMLRGNYALALEKLENAIRHDDSYAPAQHYLAELYRRLNREDEADRHYRRAIRLDPQDSALRNNYGAFLCSKGRTEDAEEQFLKVLDNPVYQERAQVYENLALCTLKEDRKKAQEFFRKALAINPKLSKSLYGMAELSYGDGSYLSARAYLQRYLEVGRHTPQSLWLGIRIERVLGDEDALASYTLNLRNQYPNSEETRLYYESLKR